MTDFTTITPSRYQVGAVLDEAILGDIARNASHNNEEITSGSEPVYLQAHNKISAEQIVGTWFGQPLYEKSYEVTGAIQGQPEVVDGTLSCLSIVPRNDWCGTASSGFAKTLRSSETFFHNFLILDSAELTYTGEGVFGDTTSFTIQYTKNSENL